MIIIVVVVGRNSVVGIATCYSLGDPGIESALLRIGHESHTLSRKMGNGFLSRGKAAGG